MSISFQSRFCVSQETLLQELGGEAVILSLTTEKYFGLNEVGTRMWKALVESPSIEVALKKLLAEYDVEESELRRDLEALVEKLVALELASVAEKKSSC